MKEVPIWEKSNLSLEEAAAYSGIGINKLRDLTNDQNCRFVLWVGNQENDKCRHNLKKIMEGCSFFTNEILTVTTETV